MAVHSGSVTGSGSTGRFNVCVSLFFVLSGFVLTWSWRPMPARAFYRNRMARLYPAYLVAWLLALPIVLATKTPLPWTTTITTLTLTQAWDHSGAVYFGANAVGWSLSVEAFFYAVFPFIAPAVVRMRSSRRWLVMAAALAACVLWMGLVGGGDHSGRTYLTSILPLARLPEFILGMCLAAAMRSGFRLPSWTGPAALLALAAALEPLQHWNSKEQAVTVVPFVVLIGALASADLLGRGPNLRRGWLVRLGSWSYCLYLVHHSVFWSAGYLLSWPHSVMVDVVAVALCCVVSLTVAALVSDAVEHPLERRLRQRTAMPAAAPRPRTPASHRLRRLPLQR